ncbi:bile acid:sodium symporter family protein [Acinetobacter gandensis]|uniref:Bile acid:sodium symporter n=1 Tax=Acinetobacter gandensis TaxID=1443941 RepID=A0A1A7RBA2_9GAMM|nr:bile acid:sodium symporter family protein [Acinetobacter gandensis]KAB0624733.1 bile acid:sodium symporter family protein [Acinetobacter gandensis]OBX29545.1 bile acid:sodium symporter [Acinetobacter gandensis]
MDSGLFAFFLPIALAIMMMGLGLELSIKDFLRVARYPKVIFIALFTQLIVLTSIAFLLCKLLELPPLLSVGLMLLAASPGGATANAFSYIYKGDVALNISITAINSLISCFTLPFIVSLSILHFLGENTEVNIPIEKITQTFLMIFIPVCIGMLIRNTLPNLAQAISKPMRLLTITLLTLIFLIAVVREQSNIISYFANVGIATCLLCFSGLFLGYVIPFLAGVPEKQARACTFEIGIHNTGIAITIALSVLGSTAIAIPAGVYSIFMYVLATLFGFILTRRGSYLIQARNTEASH